MAREMNLNISAQGHYKKKNQLKITLISGPHVHKKSRDQYKIDRFGAFSVVGGPTKLAAPGAPGFDANPCAVNSPIKERDKFLEYKNKLYRLNLDEGFSLTFTYSNRETFVI